MAETLGSLCDKLTIIKLKQYHSEDAARLNSLGQQEIQLKHEIDEFLYRAMTGVIPPEQLTFTSNKVFKQEGNETRDIRGGMGELLAELAKVNCDLWHEQEKVYEFEKVQPTDKDSVVKKLAVLNLERNKCIDAIDKYFQSAIAAKK
jgi:hypothetical protein